MTRPTPHEGDVLSGRYTLTERIAAGGMGDVWKGTDSVLGRTVAVKVMRPRTDEEASFAARFRDEGQHAARLQHPNIATVYDFGEDDGVAYLVMEFVPGVPLSELIARGPLSPARAQQLLGQCALALASAHEAGVVHRDVKPANIMVTPDGLVKLTDFGIARAVDDVGHTRTGEVMGTPQYLAPEQAQGRPVTGATDLYALGVVGFEMLTGQRPFDTGSPVATALAHINDAPPPLPAHLGDPLRAAIESCLAKNPMQRPSSAASLAALLGMKVTGVAEASPATSVISASDAQPPAPGSAPWMGGSVGAGVAGAPSRTPSTQPLPQPRLPEPTIVGPVTGNPQGYQPGYPTGYPPGYPTYPPAGPTPRRGSSGWWWLLPVVVLLALVGYAASQGLFSARTPTPTVTSTTPPATPSRTSTSASPSTTTTSPSPTPTVTVKAADHLGKQVDVVRAALTKLGLTARTELVASDRAAGTVLNVSPVGAVAITQEITLTVSDGSLAPKPTTSSAGPSSSPTTGGGG